MITGVLFLNPGKNITLEKMLKKYVFRIVLAIIVFGIPYCFMEIFFDANMSFNINQIGLAALNALQGKSWDHMWYLYMIAGLYLCIPLIKVIVTNAPKNVVEYALAVLFIFTSIIPSLESILPYKFGIYIPINSVYVFYLLLGYYIHYNNITIKNRFLWALIAAYIFFVILMPLDRNFVVLSSGGHIILTNYNSPIVVMIAFAMFCLFRQRNKTDKIIEIIAPLCFGVYLIHTLFTNFLYKFLGFSPEKYPLIIVVFSVTIITILFSILLTYLVRKIKIIRMYLL
jgi:surface polysaccharide O-acyltransferase-like enzyme